LNWNVQVSLKNGAVSTTVKSNLANKIKNGNNKKISIAILIFCVVKKLFCRTKLPDRYLTRSKMDILIVFLRKSQKCPKTYQDLL